MTNIILIKHFPQKGSLPSDATDEDNLVAAHVTNNTINTFRHNLGLFAIKKLKQICIFKKRIINKSEKILDQPFHYSFLFLPDSDEISGTRRP